MCDRATSILSLQASSPVTCAPILASCSDTSPAPQPMSSILVPRRGVAGSDVSLSTAPVLTSPSLTRGILSLFIDWRGLQTPLGFHQSEDIDRNLFTSSWLSVLVQPVVGFFCSCSVVDIVRVNVADLVGDIIDRVNNNDNLGSLGINTGDEVNIFHSNVTFTTPLICQLLKCNFKQYSL